MFLRGGETVLSGKPPKIDGLAPEQVRKRPVIFTMQQFFDQRNEKKNLSGKTLVSKVAEGFVVASDWLETDQFIPNCIDS